ncbi:MAG: hypothetical protein ACKO6Q_06955 [Bacteroidota bacterium]
MQQHHRFQVIFIFFVFCVGEPLLAQPGLSRSAARFHHRDIVLSADSSSVAFQIPTWFLPHDGRSQLYFGAVNRYGLMALTEVAIGGMIPSGEGLWRWNLATAGDAVYRAGAFDVGWVKHLSSSVWI